LHVILVAICIRYIVLQRRLKTQEYKSHVITCYHCHRGGNKDRPHKKIGSEKPSNEKVSRRRKISRLYDCAFQLKIVESKIHEKGSGALKNKGEVTIFVHSKHNGHQPRSDADNLFLHVHLEVVS
jgi:hypothetical protein